ncbi:MAG TPA: hypothetical protein VIF61_10085 [Methylocystis sp.]
MAQIISLQSRMRTPSQPAQAGDGARILFFMGVRYMRVEEYSPSTTDAPSRGDGRGGGGKRKRRARA